MNTAVEISGWGRTHKSQSQVIEFDDDNQVSLYGFTPLIPRGNGLSYGDASTIHNGWVLPNSDFKGLTLDGDVLTVGSGETISSATNFLRTFQYELPVVPGTGNVTIGGAISSDIHGKNHHQVGSFGDHVLELEIDTPNQGRKWIRRFDPNLDFSAFIGGMGLTGFIYQAKIRVVPRLSDYVRIKRQSGKGFPKLLELLDGQSASDTYSIAWIDLARITETKFPNWILDSGNDEVGHFDAQQSKASRITKLPLPPITWPTPLIKLANELIYKFGSRASCHSVLKESYFHPLDRLENWNRLLGRKGFIEYQFVVPFEHAYDVLLKVSKILVDHNLVSVFAGMKSMGPANSGFLSFPLEGITLAMDFQVSGNRANIALDLIDQIVASAGGRAYLAKDSRLSAASFNQMYPNAKLLNQYREQHGCIGVIESDMSIRLGIA
jgi:decaprenylphospho-beta-D-ribofuranose 2-oxidase